MKYKYQTFENEDIKNNVQKELFFFYIFIIETMSLWCND